MEIAIIVAFDKNRVIGNKGRIVWDFPGDRLHFKTLTTGNIVIFGRRTFEEIGKPLPGRINIVVSRTKQFAGEGLYTAQSLGEAIELGKRLGEENAVWREALVQEGGVPRAQDGLPVQAGSPAPAPFSPRTIFLCGGERIYREGMSLANTIYATEIHAEYKGDAFFTSISKEKFIICEQKSTVENGVRLDFITYTAR